MPHGAVALLGGREGVGKSTTSYDLVAKITRRALPGHLYGQPKSVVVCATEDAWAETIVPKLVAAKADLDRVLRVDSVSPERFEGALSLPADVQRLKQLIGGEDVAFVLLDPLLSTLDIELDSHKERRGMALEPLSRLAHDSQVSMLGLVHEKQVKRCRPTHPHHGLASLHGQAGRGSHGHTHHQDSEHTQRDDVGATNTTHNPHSSR
jgi:hypothetical protein